MEKIFIPLLTVAVVVGIVFAGCVPEAAPPVAPPPVAPPPVAPPPVAPPPGMVTDKMGIPIPAEVVDLVDVDRVLMDPWPNHDFAIKPDGTPYKVDMVWHWLGDDWQVACHGNIDHVLKMAGCEVSTRCYDMDDDLAISMIEDVTGLRSCDVLMFSPMSASAAVPACKALVEAGIPLFCDNVPFFSDDMTMMSKHDHAGPTGDQVAGKYFVGYIEKTGEPLHILEIWGSRDIEQAQDKHKGFHIGLGDFNMDDVVTETELGRDLNGDGQITDVVMITVIETIDTMWGDEKMASVTMDNFSAYPELNALYSNGGGQFIEGLRTIGRWVKPGEEGHVVTCVADIDTRLIRALEEGYVEANLTEGPWQIIDAAALGILNHMVLGTSVPKEHYVPVFLATLDNMYKLRLYGGTVLFPLMPMGDFEKWPVLDCTDAGIMIPTLADRQAFCGY